MDVKTLAQLAEQYPEVGELLRDNRSLSVALVVRQLRDVDANHTKVEAQLRDEIKVLSDRLDAAATFSRGLVKRIKALEAKHGRDS